VNANVPVSIAGGKVYGGNSSATQNLDNKAKSKATNDATTNQGAKQNQESSSKCDWGCGGSGQFQKLDQNANTEQKAKSEANAYQNGVNANVPVSIGGGDVSGRARGSWPARGARRRACPSRTNWRTAICASPK
jgi:hypothetical protein